MPRRKTKPSVEIIPGYTAKQSQFIRGEITVDELDGRFFRCFLKNAIAANDEYYIETAKNLLEHFKEESKTKNRERANEHLFLRKKLSTLRIARTLRYFRKIQVFFHPIKRMPRR